MIASRPSATVDWVEVDNHDDLAARREIAVPLLIGS